MTLTQRISLAVAVVALDLVAFALPLTAIAIAYVMLARPAWFLNWVIRLYEGDGSARS